MKMTTLKKILSIVSVFIFGLGSLGCNGKVFSGLLDDDDLFGGGLLPILLASQNVIPTVRLITSTTPNGTYKLGDVVNITVQFNTPVILTGTLNVTLETGTTDRVISVSAVSYPSKTLTGTYTVGVDDISSDLDSSAIDLDVGSTLTNKKLTPAILTIGSTATLATNKDLVVDGEIPEVDITTSGPINSANVTNYTVAGDCSEDGRTVSVSITDGTDTVNASPVCSGTSFTASSLNMSSLDEVTVTITAAQTDVAGNTGQDTEDVIKNTTTPVVTIESPVAINLANRTSYTVHGYCSEEGQDVDVTVGGVAGSGSCSSGEYTTAGINVSAVGDGDTISITADHEDAVGNDATQATDTVVKDTVRPTVAIGSPGDTLINSGGSTIYTLTYDEAPTGLDSGDINIQGTGVTCSTITIEDETTTSPDVTVSGCTGDGTFYITVDAGTSQDAAGNADLGDSTSDSVTVDNTPPRISSVETAKPNGTYPVGEVINIAVEFSESVTLAGGTLDMTLNSGGILNIPAFADSATDIDYTVAAGEATPVSTPLDSSGISLGTGATLVDAAGNAISNFTPLSNISAASTIYIDAVLPAITSAETMDADADGKIDHYRITFNRDINDSSFAAGQWAVAGYTITGLDTSPAAPISDTADDNILYIAFTELVGTTGDTGAKPDLTTPGALSLADFRGNPMTPIPDLGDVVETDGAAPVIMKATGQTGATGLSIEFSEQVDANGATGGCPGGDGNDLTTASFVYTDDSGDGAGDIDSMGGDTTACSASGNYAVVAVLDTDMETSDLDVDHVAPSPNAIRDMGDNWADSGRLVAITGAVSPYVYDVYANLKQKIRVAFSEPVDNSVAANATSALNHANYSLAENPVEIGCSGSGSDTVNIDTATPIVDVNGDGTVFELTTTAAQCGTTTYELTVSQAIIDQDDGVGLVPPYIMTFLGNEQLRIVSGSNLSINSMVVVFNKSVEAGTGDGGAELTTRYHFNDTSTGSAPTSAVRGAMPNANRVTLGTAFFQKARTYVIIGANGDDSYGFTEGGVGAIKTTTNVLEGAESPQESLQAYPRDRAPWVGYGTPILNLDDGPLSVDPFGNPVETFGYLASYGGKVYIGPNALGNAASRMDPDASNPELVYFQFLKDTTGTTGNDGETNQASNDATTRDDPPVAVPPYVTIGHTGCATDTADLNTGCGPDNENGRGVFSSGMIGSTEYIFLGGARTTPDGDDRYWFDYVYYTSGTGDTLTFNYVDMGTITGTVTSGLSTNLLFNDRLQVGMAKVNYDTDGNNAPDFGKISFNSADTGDYCTPGSSCDASDGTRGDRYMINYIDYFGGRDQYGTENTHANNAYIVGVDSLYSFNGRLYAANGGLNYMNRDGGVIRSDGANYANPAICDGQDDCPNWVEIAPRSQTEWYNTDEDASGIRFSLELVKLADQIPSDKATPAFAEYEGKLYMIRNTCAVRNANGNIQTSAHYTAGCTQDTSSDPYDYVTSEFENRQPQLWVCTPGADDECDAGDWAMVDNASSPDGVTNFGDPNNHSITMVMKSGKYLYVGLDNVNGIQVYRVKTEAGVPIASPTEDDFERIGTGVPGIDGTEYKEIYSYITIPGTGIYSNYSFLYISAGMNSTPVAIFIEMGGNTAAYE